FRGLTSINLDAKGRMAIPSRYRGIIDDHCQGKMVVTIEATFRATEGSVANPVF
ncbi:MAG: hypothetical protein HOK55_04360, partial [Gammaproteobacteria bacterium]|nr:hypothetical protein [Gammaproteobacteria bacterium]